MVCRKLMFRRGRAASVAIFAFARCLFPGDALANSTHEGKGAVAPPASAPTLADATPPAASSNSNVTDRDGPALSEEQRREKDSLESELAKERATYRALLLALEKGMLERTTLAAAIDRSEKHVLDLSERVCAMKSVSERSIPSSPARRLEVLAIPLLESPEPLSPRAPASVGAVTHEADRPTAAEPPGESAEPKGLGINIDAGVAGLYAFRGLNVWKGGSQMDQHALFSPGITYNPTGAEGLSLAYAGFYQLTGDNASRLVKAGIGNEQDLTVSYGRYVVKDKVQARVGVTNYLYPFAESAVAHTSTPYFFEPWTQVTYEGRVTASLLGSYFYGTEDAVRSLSYVYVHPAVEKTFAVNKTIGFVPAAGLGYKVFTHDSALSDNRYEITGDMKLPIASGLSSYVTPGVHYAWTNFSSGAVASAHAVWLSMNVGLNL